MSAEQRHALSAALAMPLEHAQIGWGSLVVWVAPGHFPLPVAHDELNLLSEQPYDALHDVNASFWQLVAKLQPAAAAPVQVPPVQPVWPLLTHLRLGHWLSLVHQHVELTA